MSEEKQKKKRGPRPKGPVYDPEVAAAAHKASIEESVKRAFEKAFAERIPSNLPREKIQSLKRKIGRPSKYDPAYCDLAIEIMAEGKSIASVACAIGVARSKLWEWGEANPQFRNALDLGKELSQQYWENLSSEMGNGEASLCDVKSKGSSGMVQFMMSRRFPDYYTKTQSDIKSEVKQTHQVYVFESQLANGVIRQSATNLEESPRIDSIIDELSEDLCKQSE